MNIVGDQSIQEYCRAHTLGSRVFFCMNEEGPMSLGDLKEKEEERCQILKNLNFDG